MTSDWHTNDYPELRAQPPWVMEEMIDAQVALPDATAALTTTAVVRAAIARALGVGEDVQVVGCGTSEHAAHAVTALLRDGFATQRFYTRQALDAALDPPTSGLVIGISHDGGTRATLLALQAAHDAGAATAVITARADSAVVDAADLTVITPALDRSWCHTLAYTSAITAAAAIAGTDAAWTAPARAALDPARIPDARQAGRALHPAGRILTAGIGTDHVAARELALKIEEGARIAATAHHLETLLHGHLAGADAADTRLVLLAGSLIPGGRAALRLAIAARTSAAIGIPVTIIATPSVAATLPASTNAVALPDPHPDAPLLTTILATTIALQLMTLGLIDAAGTNPDLIRREQAPYRAAAGIADADAAW